MRAALLRLVLQFTVVPEVIAEGFLIGRNNVDTTLQPSSISIRNVGTCRAIDDDGVRQMIGIDVLLECVEIQVDRRTFVGLFPNIEIDPGDRPATCSSSVRWRVRANRD